MTTDWHKRIIATFNNYLHNACSMCPGNHTVEYTGNRIYLDGEKMDTDICDMIRDNAHKNKAAGIEVRYSETYNSFVLVV